MWHVIKEITSTCINFVRALRKQIDFHNETKQKTDIKNRHKKASICCQFGIMLVIFENICVYCCN